MMVRADSKLDALQVWTQVRNRPHDRQEFLLCRGVVTLSRFQILSAVPSPDITVAKRQ
jgi:hypothetical protein